MPPPLLFLFDAALLASSGQSMRRSPKRLQSPDSFSFVVQTSPKSQGGRGGGMPVPNYGTLPFSPQPPKRKVVGLVVVASLACVACVATLGHLTQGTGVATLMSFDDQVLDLFLYYFHSLCRLIHAYAPLRPPFLTGSLPIGGTARPSPDLTHLPRCLWAHPRLR
jgi:hypothetical protein